MPKANNKGANYYAPKDSLKEQHISYRHYIKLHTRSNNKKSLNSQYKHKSHF